MKKNNYEAPEAELFVVRFEGNLCQSNPAQTYRKGGAGYYDLENDFYDNGEY